MRRLCVAKHLLDPSQQDSYYNLYSVKIEVMPATDASVSTSGRRKRANDGRKLRTHPSRRVRQAAAARTKQQEQSNKNNMDQLRRRTMPCAMRRRAVGNRVAESSSAALIRSGRCVAGTRPDERGEFRRSSPHWNSDKLPCASRASHRGSTTL